MKNRQHTTGGHKADYLDTYSYTQDEAQLSAENPLKQFQNVSEDEHFPEIGDWRSLSSGNEVSSLAFAQDDNDMDVVDNLFDDIGGEIDTSEPYEDDIELAEKTGLPGYRDDNGNLIDSIDRLGKLGTDHWGRDTETDGWYQEAGARDGKQFEPNLGNGKAPDPGDSGYPDPGDGGDPDPGDGKDPDPGDGGNPDPGDGGDPDPGDGGDPDPGDGGDPVHYDFAARAVLMYADSSNDRLLFQILERTVDSDGNESWQPMALEPGADLSSILTLTDEKGYLALDSIQVGADGMVSIAVKPDAIAHALAATKTPWRPF